MAVPTISRFHGIEIRMFFDDHGFPHFHARHADGEAKVRIDSPEVLSSSLKRRQLSLVLALGGDPPSGTRRQLAASPRP